VRSNKKIYKIALLGSYPPPYGGVTIHIQRLKKFIEQRGFECCVYDFNNSPVSRSEKDIIIVRNPLIWAIRYFFSKKEDIVHTHNSDWRIRLIVGSLSFTGAKTIVTIHGDSLKKSTRGKNFIKKFFVIFFLKRSNFIIAVNREIYDLCTLFGIKKEKLVVIPGFIPPIIQAEQLEIASEEVRSFIQLHSPLLVGYAYKILFFDNQDLYGIDLCIDLCFNLKRNYPNIGFIFILPLIGDTNYYDTLNKKIAECKLDNNFLFITGEENQFIPVLVKSELLVRPTNTDGDSLSIREALFFRIPVIASDVVGRPDGVVLFKNRDLKNLTETTLEILKNYDTYKNRISHDQLENSADRIIGIYENLIAEKYPAL